MSSSRQVAGDRGLDRGSPPSPGGSASDLGQWRTANVANGPMRNELPRSPIVRLDAAHRLLHLRHQTLWPGHDSLRADALLRSSRPPARVVGNPAAPRALRSDHLSCTVHEFSQHEFGGRLGRAYPSAAAGIDPAARGLSLPRVFGMSLSIGA